MKARTSLFLRTIASVVDLALAVACAKPANDTQTVSSIQAKLSSDSGLQGKQMTVQSDKGTVTLSGTVDNDTQREAAAKYAASEPGVKTVINNLQVASGQASADNAPAPAMEPGSRARAEAPAPRARSSKPSPSRKPSHQTAQPENQMAQAAPAALPAPAAQSQDQAPTQPAAAPAPPPEIKKV